MTNRYEALIELYLPFPFAARVITFIICDEHTKVKAFVCFEQKRMLRGRQDQCNKQAKCNANKPVMGIATYVPNSLKINVKYRDNSDQTLIQGMLKTTVNNYKCIF